jgi:Leucine-rich repeat (LRR) protein
MSRQFSDRTTLHTLKKEAKRWLKALAGGVRDARVRFERAYPDAPRVPTLRDVQHALALEHGVPGWAALKARLAGGDPMRPYDDVARAVVEAYATGDERAMRVVWDYFDHRRTWDVTRRYLRLALGKTEQPLDAEDDRITFEEARSLVARGRGFANWAALAAFVAARGAGAASLTTKPIEIFEADESGTRTTALQSREWEEVFAILRERRLPALNPSGQATDELLARLSLIDHLTSLDLSGSKALTATGLRALARMPQLRELNLSGCQVTDDGLAVLRHLPALERVALAWTPITDAGVEHLAACERLRSVDLSGTGCGDGALRALAGKGALADLRSGNNVTDDGLALLRELPVFAAWQGGESSMALLSPEARPNYLMLRGPFTDRGLARLAALEGLYALNVDSSQLAITGAGLAPLAGLPHFAWLAFDARDDSMRDIAALPHLRFLLCQDTSAGDDGFAALSRSQSIEFIWGRRCYNLKRRGFTALAAMPALRHLSVSCKNVDDEGVAALPRFPALQELMPMDVPDEGYRHIARCARLESLVLMYCRDTTDAATAHITGLATLKKYFASYNRITDRTPEMLSGMPSLEEVSFSACAGLTNAGVRALARLPRLRLVDVGGMPNVTSDVADAFPPHVRVKHGV